MTLRLTPQQSAALRTAAEREGRSMHETAVIAIEEYISKRDAKRDRLIATILDQDRDVIDRLGTV